jgi:hypothetical protein
MYVPQANDEGLALFLAAFRDYLAADAAITSLLPAGASSIIPEGFFTADTSTPTLLVTTIGDGESVEGIDVQLVRLLVWVMHRGRGYYEIERLLHRARVRINDTPSAVSFFTFPETEPLRLWHIKAAGTTASASFPHWQAEGRGLYVFANIGGLSSAE